MCHEIRDFVRLDRLFLSITNENENFLSNIFEGMHFILVRLVTLFASLRSFSTALHSQFCHKETNI